MLTQDEVGLRDVTLADASAVQAIYAHHVLHGTASYDTDPPSLADTKAKIARITSAGWPFIVATTGSEVVAYGYVTQFRDRPAYAYACENSIYVHPDWMGRGIGRQLLIHLCERAERYGFRQMIAVIGGAEKASVRLHASCGFRQTGRLHGMGWKHERWLDTVYMQRELGCGSSTSP